MSSNVGKKCFKLWCVLCAVQFVTELWSVYGESPYTFGIGSLMMVQMDRNM
jgi:hypothetical protein